MVYFSVANLAVAILTQNLHVVHAEFDLELNADLLWPNLQRKNRPHPLNLYSLRVQGGRVD